MIHTRLHWNPNNHNWKNHYVLTFLFFKCIDVLSSFTVLRPLSVFWLWGLFRTPRRTSYTIPRVVSIPLTGITPDEFHLSSSWPALTKATWFPRAFWPGTALKRVVHLRHFVKQLFLFLLNLLWPVTCDVCDLWPAFCTCRVVDVIPFLCFIFG